MRKAGFIIDLFLSYTENMMNYIGHLVINLKEKNGSLDADSIAKILKDIESNLDGKHRNLLVSAMFDFITPEGDTIASTLHGVINPPKKVKASQREYIELGKKEPWKLHICEPDAGLTIEEIIIPLAIGITDNDNNFLGYVTSGIGINKFKKKLSEIVQNEYYSFIVLNNDLNYILYSGEEENITRENKSENKTELKYLKEKEENFGTLDETMFIDGTEYIFYTKANDYPFTIIIGIKRKDVFNLRDLERKILALEKEGDYHQMFLFALLYMFQDKIINPIVSNRPHYSNFEIPKVFSTKVNDLFLALDQMEGFMEIKIQKEVVEESKKIREKFFKMVLHDLKNPTGALDNVLELIENKAIKSAEAFEIMKNAVSKITNILNGLQLTAKIESNTLNLNKVEINLSEFLDGIIKVFKFDIDIKKLYLKKDIRINNATIFGDRQLILRILTNLVNNAIKFTQEGGITIIVEEEGDEKIITVRDTGCGIRTCVVSEIMNGEEDRESSEYMKEENSLLFGLSAIKKFVEKHNGKFEIKSEIEKGTDIIVRFKTKDK